MQNLYFLKELWEEGLLESLAGAVTFSFLILLVILFSWLIGFSLVLLIFHRHNKNAKKAFMDFFKFSLTLVAYVFVIVVCILCFIISIDLFTDTDSLRLFKFDNWEWRVWT